MEALLVIFLFVATALSLYFVANEHNKLSGACDVISLCLIVAIAYQLELMTNILLVVVGIVAVLLGIFIFMRKRKKDMNDKIIEYGGK